jgi:hypothetical protein
MSDRSLIFNTKGTQIGYIEGDRAFDLTGRERCNYARTTGNLSELNGKKIVGYISLDGTFVGLSWISEELFGKPSIEVSSRSRDNPASSAEEGHHSATREVERQGAEGCVATDRVGTPAREPRRAFTVSFQIRRGSRNGLEHVQNGCERSASTAGRAHSAGSEQILLHRK